MKTNKDPEKSCNPAPKGEDRRIRRTKNLLKKALIELILENGFENVRVQDVIDRADVGRTSFYSHFKSKEDLLLQNLDDLEELFEPKPPENDNEKNRTRPSQEFSLMMFRHLKENWILARALMGNKRIPVVRNHVQKIITNYFKKQYKKELPETTTEREIEGAAIFTSGALISMTLWWLSMKDPLPPEKMHEMFILYHNGFHS